jgi:signal transduction histidine kinase
MIVENCIQSDTNESPVAAMPSNHERRILILAPTGKDAQLTAEFLTKARLFPHVCRDVPELCDEIGDGCGAIILAEEILLENSIGGLVSLLAGQPSWSDVPILLVTSGGEASQTQIRRLGIFGPAGNVILLERPFRPGTLISTLEVALRARQRQYEARDFVEELKRAHDEIQVASQAKDRFLAALSHELRTPLNPALLIASEFAVDHGLSEEVRRNFETIRNHIELEARLIDDLLDLTRITSGKMILNRQPVDVHQVLTDALAIVQPDCEEKHIQVNLKLGVSRCIVDGDAVRLQQVFWNILKNAVKFTPSHGTITVESSVSGGNEDYLCVQVKDTGIGMIPAELANVFHAFVQGDHRFGGLGLGLAITKNLVQLHMGRLSADSAGRNQGSTFSVELPLAAN